MQYFSIASNQKLQFFFKVDPLIRNNFVDVKIIK